MDCKVCYVPFDELLRRPRNLECGHSFCTTCLKNILVTEGHIVCPECRFSQDVEDVCKLPVGYGVLRAIEAIRGEALKSEEEDEEEDQLFILPKLKKDVEQEGESKGAAAATNEESAMEQLRKCYRNILWSRIYLCAENIEELQSYDRTIKSVTSVCQTDLQSLATFMRSRQYMIDYLQDEIECRKKKREVAEVKKRELFECKEQRDETAVTADIHVLPDRYIQQRNRFDQLLKTEEEASKQLRQFSSCICRNDKTLIRTLASEDSLDLDITNLFVEMADR